MIELTPSQIEYLRAIYLLSLKGKITVTGIAELLDYSKPSVVKALKTLHKLELLVYDNTGITITSFGKRYAKNIIRRDSVLQRFFTEILEIDPSVAKKDSDNLKNVVSCYTITKLENYLDNLLGEDSNKEEEYCICSRNISTCDCTHKEK
ncbi:MAG: metal-dependent transcriptional regulator [Bacilli bacterium]|nr:metal-dependent transcriptional regulator [Bacilli bacterium]